MPNNRRILKNVVNNDLKAENLREKRGGHNEMRKPGVTKVVKSLTLPGKEEKKLEAKKEARKVEVRKKKEEEEEEEEEEEARREETMEADTVVDDVTDQTEEVTVVDDIVFDIDEGDEENPQLMSELASDVYAYLKELEDSYTLKRDFMAEQKELTSRMRGTLINWLVLVHSRFHLLQETLFSSVSIVDHYLQKVQVSKDRFQLLGITALWLASKMEEIYVATVEDYIYVTDNTFSKSDVEEMELSIVKVLDFKLNKPLQIHFLRRFSKAGQVDMKVHNLSKFLLELSLIEYPLASVPASLLASASLFLSRKIFYGVGWNSNLTYHSSYNEDTILPVASRLARLLTTLSSSKLQATQRKYAVPKFHNISRSDKLQSPVVQQLASLH